MHKKTTYRCKLDRIEDASNNSLNQQVLFNYLESKHLSIEISHKHATERALITIELNTYTYWRTIHY